MHKMPNEHFMFVLHLSFSNAEPHVASLSAPWAHQWLEFSPFYGFLARAVAAPVDHSYHASDGDHDESESDDDDGDGHDDISISWLLSLCSSSTCDADDVVDHDHSDHSDDDDDQHCDNHSDNYDDDSGDNDDDVGGSDIHIMWEFLCHNSDYKSHTERPPAKGHLGPSVTISDSLVVTSD